LQNKLFRKNLARIVIGEKQSTTQIKLPIMVCLHQASREAKQSKAKIVECDR